ncbi:MAG: MBL fold metallo-hydrolase [Promethearchaeota archaeon]
MNLDNENIFEWLGEWDVPYVSLGDGTCSAFGSMGTTGVINTEEGLVIFDLPIRNQGPRIFMRVRELTKKPVKFIIYSHGHFDHCFGYAPFIEECKKNGWEMPQVIAHENLLLRFKKYAMLDDYHDWINSMQFSSIVKESGVSAHETLDPTILVRDEYSFKLGNCTFELYHDKGETDDSIWLWVPEKKVIYTGDLVQISYPNVGNPYKVQRYPKDWAIALEKMLEKNPEYLVIGHGKPIQGNETVREHLSITSEALHFVHDEVVKRLNQGKWFEEIFHEMLEIYPEKFDKFPYLQPIYGCYRFAIHATYRLYHGWYDTGNPTDLFPSKSSDIAKELLKVNSPEKYLEHAKSLNIVGKHQLALHVLDIIINGGEDLCSQELYLETISLKQQLLKKIAREEPSFIASNIINNGASQLKQKAKELRKNLRMNS